MFPEFMRIIDSFQATIRNTLNADPRSMRSYAVSATSILSLLAGIHFALCSAGKDLLHRLLKMQASSLRKVCPW